jgi:hypothetical protein
VRRIIKTVIMRGVPSITTEKQLLKKKCAA